MLTLAVIPARAGSEGLPGKHLALLGGIPVIVHTIRAALGATRVDRVLVSTNDPAIARVARRAGAEVPFRRPDELARSDTPTLPVIEHAVAWVEARGRAVDLIVTLQPTSPLRGATDIDKTIALLDDPEVQSALTVLPLDLPASVIGALLGGRLVRPAAFSSTLRRQESPVAGRVTGGVFVARRSLLATGRMLDEAPAAYLVEPDSAIDIDSAEDLMIARRAWRRRHRS